MRMFKGKAVQWSWVLALALGLWGATAQAEEQPDKPKAEAKEGEKKAEGDGEKKEGEADKPKEPKDMTLAELVKAELCPVCRKESKPVYRHVHKDVKYNFSSRDCKKAFSENPAKYGVKMSDKEQKDMADKKAASKAEAEKHKADKKEAKEGSMNGDDEMMMNE